MPGAKIPIACSIDIHRYLRIPDAIRAIGGAEDEVEETATALASIVEIRERTNRDIIALYTRMYEGLQNPPLSEDMRLLKQLGEISKGCSPPQMGMMEKYVDAIFAKAGIALPDR